MFKLYFIDGSGESNGPTEYCGSWDDQADADRMACRMVREISGYAWITDESGETVSEWGAA